MGFSGVSCVVVALLSWGLLCLVWGEQSYIEGPSHLHCGITSLQFYFPSLVTNDSLVLRALDNNGMAHDLHNNSACGTWVSQRPNGSLVLGAAFDGCYVREEDGYYVMTVILEDFTGNIQDHKKDLKCPIMPAMDAPSPGICTAVQRADRLLCASSPVSRDACESIGCCFNPSDSTLPCYFGNKLTAQCTTDNQVVVAIAAAITTPSLIMSSVNVLTVNKATCPGLSVSQNNAFIVYQFPLSCGSASQVDTNTIVYENQFEATKDVLTWQGASITRDSTMKLTVRCSYSQNSVVPLQVEVFTLPPPLPVSTTGPLSLAMRIAKGKLYGVFYADGDYPIVKVLRDKVYLEVRILRRNDPNLVLVLNECWATPSNDANQQPQWPILHNGCPFTGDNYLTEIIPVAASQTVRIPSYYQRFSINTFAFVDGRSQLSLGGLVYIHCSATVCVPSASSSCETTCGRRKKRVAANLTKEPWTLVSSDGPVDFIDASMVESRTMTGDFPVYTELAWAKGTAAAGGILTVLFVVLGVWKYQSPKIYTVKV